MFTPQLTQEERKEHEAQLDDAVQAAFELWKSLRHSFGSDYLGNIFKQYLKQVPTLSNAQIQAVHDTIPHQDSAYETHKSVYLSALIQKSADAGTNEFTIYSEENFSYFLTHVCGKEPYSLKITLFGKYNEMTANQAKNITLTNHGEISSLGTMVNSIVCNEGKLGPD